MEQYVDLIRQIREDKGLKQKDVAKYLGITQQVYSRYELGKNEMPIRYLAALCDYYNVSADYMLGRTKDETKRGETV